MDNPFDIKNRSFAVGSETTYTQEWGRRRSVVSVANQTAAARGRFCLWHQAAVALDIGGKDGR
jgi:hypothetical protein